MPVQLRPHVTDWVGVEERVGRPFERRHVPTATATIMVGFGEPGTSLPVDYTVGTPPPPNCSRSSVIALHQRAVMSSSTGIDMVQVELEPLGAYRLFGVPIRELAGKFVELSHVLADADELVERLAEAGVWDDRFDLLEKAFARRLAEGPEPNPTVNWAWQRIRRSRGKVSVAKLAEEVGWSRRHLNRLFREQVGLPPKAVVRLQRLQAAVELICAPSPGSLTDLAVACGYYDHAHLNLDFRDILGCTPTRFLAERLAGHVYERQQP